MNGVRPDAERPRDRGALGRLLTGVRPPSAADPEAVREHLDALTKPPGSLGKLEDLAIRIAVICGDPPPPLHDAVVFVLAADHGVAARGVSAYPPEVTAQMLRNFRAGGAAINAIAGAVGARLVVADFGVAVGERAEERAPTRDAREAAGDPRSDDAPGEARRSHAAPPRVHVRATRRGTRDLSVEPAMTRREATAAVLAGARLFDEEAGGARVAALGEMGIGNTTAAAAIAAAVAGAPPEAVVGPGTGVGREGRRRKIAAVEAGLARLGTVAGADPLRILCEVGGLEIAGLVGLTLAAAGAGCPVVTDGFIATAAASLAVRLSPNAAAYLIASHRSPEPGHSVLLEVLGMRPLFDLGLRLGEGTGAALALPWIAAAGAVLRDMATFEAASVSGPAETETG